MRFWKKYSKHNHVQWKSKTVLERFRFVVEWPFVFVIGLTVPVADRQSFKKNLAVIYPFTSFWAILFFATTDISKLLPVLVLLMFVRVWL
jgi:hypothetical protein